MDKLSILKLIGNFLNKNAENTQETQANEVESNKTDPPLSFLENLVKPIANLSKESENKSSPPPVPLQKEMLSAMASHDEFLKRVNKNNLK